MNHTRTLPVTTVGAAQVQLQFAEIARANGDLSQASQLFSDLAHSASRQVRNQATWGLARTEAARGDYNTALGWLEVVLRASRAHEPGAPPLLRVQSFICQLYNESGEPGGAADFGERAFEDARQRGDDGSEGAVYLLSQVAFAYQLRGDLLSAGRVTAEMMERAEQLKSREARAWPVWLAAQLAEVRGEPDKAIDLTVRALALLAESPLPRNMATLRINYAYVLLRSDPPRLDEADALLAAAHETLAEQGMARLLCACETEMAWSALLRGDPGLAAEVAHRAAARCATDPSLSEMQNARVVEGVALVRLGHAARGAELAGTAAEALAAAGLARDSAHAWRGLGETLLREGHADAGMAALRRAANSYAPPVTGGQPGQHPGKARFGPS